MSLAHCGRLSIDQSYRDECTAAVVLTLGWEILPWAIGQNYQM